MISHTGLQSTSTQRFAYLALRLFLRCIKKLLLCHFKLDALKFSGFECDPCEAKLEKQSNLVRHQKTHIDEDPVKCVKCKRAFIRKDLFMLHMKKKHPQDYENLMNEN